MCSSRETHQVHVEELGKRRSPDARPDLRASDADREAVAERLRDHGAAGRLSTEELEERVATALEARTVGELDEILSDLPSDRSQRSRAARVEAARRGLREHFRTYAMVMVLLVAIWALTGMGYFWPVWPMLGWGIGLASHAACTPRRRRSPARDALARV